MNIEDLQRLNSGDSLLVNFGEDKNIKELKLKLYSIHTFEESGPDLEFYNNSNNYYISFTGANNEFLIIDVSDINSILKIDE
jgi:hypothetical protein